MKGFLVCLTLGATCAVAMGQLVVSGNENKIDLSSGQPRVVPDAGPDSLTFLDFTKFPPRVEHLRDIPNSVIGPPSNIAIDRRTGLVLVANSIKVDPGSGTNWVPESFVHVLDLADLHPKQLGKVVTGRQPSGIAFHPSGALALVANRADGTISVLRIREKEVTSIQTVKVCEPAEEVADVAVHPNGKLALASVHRGGYLRVLEIQGTKVVALDRKVSVYGQPYRCVITADGELGLTAGPGQGNGPDWDALSIVDLGKDRPQTIGFVPLGSGPESIEISPDGKLLAAVLMNGSNLTPERPDRTDHGLLVILARKGKTFEPVQRIRLGRIPEGVAFASNGRYLVVQCHPARQLWVFRVRGRHVEDTGQRIDVPGMPASIRGL